MKTTYAVIHNPTLHRFEVTIDAHTAVLDYSFSGDTITFLHTGVPSALEGRGIGSELVKSGLAYAHENKFKVTSLCWFVDKYMQRHPDWNANE
jgi:predicted GNAT family acetyltransferase